MTLTDVDAELTAIADDLHRRIRNSRRSAHPVAVATTRAYRTATHAVEDLRNRVRAEVRA